MQKTTFHRSYRIRVIFSLVALFLVRTSHLQDKILQHNGGDIVLVELFAPLYLAHVCELAQILNIAGK